VCARESRLPLDEDYKGHHIRSVPRQLPESRRWTSHVVINWTAGAREQFRQFEIKRGFAIQEEAEREGLTFAKKWIDNRKPKLRERGTGAAERNAEENAYAVVNQFQRENCVQQYEGLGFVQAQNLTPEQRENLPAKPTR
jgi:hypothetical protein